MKTDIEQSLSAIESWLDKKGFVLCKSNKRSIEDEVDFERKVVFLSLRSKPLFQLYSLLHECGHVVLRTKKDYRQRFKEHAKVSEGLMKPTIRSSVEEVEEEMLAWREGEVLARKLNIELDTDIYYKYGYKWVMGYILVASIGNEHVLPAAKDIKEERNRSDKDINISKLLDNVYDPCYYKLISNPET